MAVRHFLSSILIVALTCAAAGATDNSPLVETAGDPASAGVATAPTEAETFLKTATLQSYDLSWWSVDGGGAVSTGGAFSLTAAIGQPESGTSIGGGAVLDAGLWSGAIDMGLIFADGFEVGSTGNWSSGVGD